MIILCVDLGDVRTGLAVCDKNEILASPLTVVNQKSPNLRLEEIAKAAKEQKAELVVVGLPRNMDGSFGESAEKCRKFAGELAAKTGLTVDLYDERVTTKIAIGYLNETNVRGKKRKSVIDAAAAVVILQGYLDYRKRTDIHSVETLKEPR